VVVEVLPPRRQEKQVIYKLNQTSWNGLKEGKTWSLVLPLFLKK